MNVCSRRVHDGYATIRSRGRPRAVYRSDSEELLKEAGDGPYALPCLSNFRLVGEDTRQVPRWADPGRDQPPVENYGTLRVARSRDLEEPHRVTLKTFSKREKQFGNGNSRNEVPRANIQRSNEDKGKHCEIGLGQKKNRPNNVDLCGHYGWKLEDCACYGYRKDLCANDRRIYDTVPIEDDSMSLKPFHVAGNISQGTGFANVDNNRRDASKSSRENTENVKQTSVRGPDNVRNDISRSSKNVPLFKNERKCHGDLEYAKRGASKDHGQPIYAVPNVFSRSRRERRTVIVDGNYVPSGDLYRTTAKYIEDINRNLAEIDKSYEVLKANPRTYGVVNRIAKGELLPLRDRSCDLFGYARKRDMAPMPPIIGVDIDDIAIEERSDKAVLGKETKYLRRPNSRGRLPPKVLPRSTSIENTSRHSTGSTTASSSKSTESLYAISESLIELSKAVGNIPQEQDAALNRIRPESGSSRKDNSQDLSNSNGGRSTMLKTTSCNDEVEGSEFKDETSSTDDDTTISRHRLPVTGAIRKNRSRVDQEAERLVLKKERDLNVVETLERIPGECGRMRSLENHFKDRRCDTLPSRRPKISSKPLHKSSEDVLDGRRTSREYSNLQRSCSSIVDVGRKRSADEELADVGRGPIYAMDATDVIIKGQMERSGRMQWHDRFPRTRHNSLECDEEDDKAQHSGFATLPRRGNLSKDQSDPPRRFSGNGPILEPLYEHAVSDPVKSRGTRNVIPWWELATKKYRHRSCPSLQVNLVMLIKDWHTEIAVVHREFKSSISNRKITRM